MSSNSSNIKGLIYAGIACIFWSTLYIDTTFIAPYGTADLAIARFSFTAVAAAAILLAKKRIRFIYSELNSRQLILASFLGFIGFTGYYFFLATAIKYSSDIITVAIIGMISVVTLLANNAIHKEFSWIAACIPAALGISGTADIIYYQTLASDFSLSSAGWRLWLGIGAALIALMMWSTYQVLNKLVLERLTTGSTISLEDWTLLTLIGGALALPVLVALLPLSPLHGEFTLFDRQPDKAIIPLLTWGLFLAFGASLLSLRAWNESQIYLPPSLSGQAIVFLLPLVFTLCALNGRFITHPVGTIAGVALVISSVFSTILIKHPPAWLPRMLSAKNGDLPRDNLN